MQSEAGVNNITMLPISGTASTGKGIWNIRTFGDPIPVPTPPDGWNTPPASLPPANPDNPPSPGDNGFWSYWTQWLFYKLFLELGSAKNWILILNVLGNIYAGVPHDSTNVIVRGIIASLSAVLIIGKAIVDASGNGTSAKARNLMLQLRLGEK